jgi:hypothetical protein
MTEHLTIELSSLDLTDTGALFVAYRRCLNGMPIQPSN